MKTHAIAGLIALALAAVSPGGARPASPPDYALRLAQDEVIYFVLPDRFADGDPSNDRGGATGGRLATGYDPTDQGFYQGGDLAGLTRRLDYIQHLGATALWVAPVFRNKWVQGPPGHQSAGYHGYWITDFTDVDPHFGTRADFKRFVDAAHARGMKVILDIVINHTADVIRYRECPGFRCPYRSEGAYPFTRRGGPNGAPINAGFQGDDEAHLTPENFAHLTRPDFAYTPYVPAGEVHVKKPEWLNDPIYYHNRGDFAGSGAQDMITHGDFFGLDDVATENPRVVQGFIDVYERWIADFGIDGYRIDTARHVNPGFWRAFIPAVLDFARAHGKPNFHIFGEVADPDSAVLARHTRVDGFPAVLDFGFQAAARAVVGGAEGPARLAHTFLADPDFAPDHGGAVQLPTFVSNHDDAGRLASQLHKDHPAMGREEILRRVELGHALMMFSRGVPTIYYGDEQGLAGRGGDQAARQTLFASRVPSYQAERPLGAARAGAPGYDEAAPLYRAISAMAAIRNAHVGLRRGAQAVRIADDKPGLYVFTRTDPSDGQYVIALNTSLQPRSADTVVDVARDRWSALHGACARASAAPGSLHVEVPALGWIVCRSGGAGA